ncbi:MAG: flagellin lysine-N-methylase [Desulfobulbaceae bacterium]|nr:flagellin lysine-N-methylase [Desulfobulbaceae bacterium]
MTAPIKLNCTSLRHATRFKCIGSACEEDCCHNWKVVLDQAGYKKTKEHLAQTEAGRLLFRRHVRERRKHQTAAEYADITLLANGDCPFIDPRDRLCVLHRDFGESCLSKTCRTYPRKLALVGNRFELSLELSCPEAARSFLFDPDFDLIQIDRSPFTKGNFYISTYPVDATNPLSQYHDLIRGTVLQLLSIADYPLNSRLFFASFFANRTVPFFSRQAKNFSEPLLAAEIKLLTNPQLLDALHGQFETLAVSADLPIDLPMSFILAILLGRTGKTGSLDQLLQRIWENYGRENMPEQQKNTGNQEEFQKIVATYKELRTATPRAVTERLESYLDRYSQYFWFSHLYSEAPNLLIHTRRLFIRLAMLRFLLYSHPEINELRQLSFNANLTAQHQAKIGTVAVDVFYRLARGIEHDSGLLTKIEQTLDKNNMRDIEHVCLLLLI